jgi:hypothetical protein
LILGKPGAGAPLIDPKTGNAVTHLHHGISGFTEPDYQVVHEIKDHYRDVLEKQLQDKIQQPPIAIDPTKLKHRPSLDNAPRHSHGTTDILPKRQHTAYSNLHPRSTTDYLEFGLPGGTIYENVLNSGGAPRLQSGNTPKNGHHEIETHIPVAIMARPVVRKQKEI